ncbi:DUF2742 domain-containing protein [Mycobacterium gordonae]|uniref:DUF2742 domain-containing protein n=1 Tax=Mycobacterium gordonae TaxID=1778 RepID=UPI0009F67A35|nr:DUF2742 domain-containing protein [Mycobacterium gordonae]MCV7007915.1 DUF2742 domain-containing protein [Mycobacterium gordonae]PJE23238.1 MAG: DUF2742 domain-containing protein [Mycobacterium sp.]
MTYTDEGAGLRAGFPPSQQVSWYETFTYATQIAQQHHISIDSHLPIPGTPQWCGMPDDDARKMLALILGGVREALNHDTRQEQTADASRQISCAADWSATARRVHRGRGTAYIPRKAS